MMNLDIDRLLNYERWANGGVLEAVRRPDAPDKARRIAAHVVTVHRLWLSRVGIGQALPVWPDPESINMKEELEKAYADWRELLDSDAPFDPLISYVNSQGEHWTSRLGDIVTHVFLHSAYHRGQIATLMGAARLEPPCTDYIHGVRSGLIDA